MNRRSTSLLLGTLFSTTALALAPLSYEQIIERWRTTSVEELKQPHGALSLIGLHWLVPGTHTVGSADDNAIALATGPAHLGTVTFADGKVTLTVVIDSGATIDGVAPTSAVQLQPDSSATPTTISLDEGQATIQLIERGDKFALRVRDARARTRTDFVGIDYFTIDASWRVTARFKPHPDGKTIEIAKVGGQLQPMENPGVVIFEREGKTYRLEVVGEVDGELFLIFGDRTNGKDTYGAGRFLYADPVVEGKTVVDFNKAYNPPCAFNAWSTCPLPPPENRLDLAITAGEKKYRGATH